MAHTPNIEAKRPPGPSDWIDKTHIGDCRDLLRQMAADGVRVQMCVTSPPYFGLRDYGHSEQIGLELTPAAYVSQLVTVFRLVREILSDDGVLWLNLGDCYAHDETLGHATGKHGRWLPTSSVNRSKRQTGLKEKNLIGVPWLVAFALRAEGWILRSDIIWTKPNAMPESVKDRPTRSHEYLFLFARSAHYYYDAAAICEPAVTRKPGGTDRGPQRRRDDHRVNDGRTHRKQDGHGRRHANFNARYKAHPAPTTRNRRSVWTISTKPFIGSHFATFPPGLVAPCILAGSKVGDVVLDPFMGSGTTAVVASALGRRFIGCEINTAYVKLHKLRCATIGQSLPLF